MLVPGVVLVASRDSKAPCEHHFLSLNLAIWPSAGKGGENAADASHAPIEIFAKAAGAFLRTAWPRPSRPSPPPDPVLRHILRECGRMRLHLPGGLQDLWDLCLRVREGLRQGFL